MEITIRGLGSDELAVTVVTERLFPSLECFCPFFFFFLTDSSIYRHVWGYFLFSFSLLSFYKYPMPTQRVPFCCALIFHFKKSFPSPPCRVFISEDLFLLVVARDVEPVICLSLPYPLLVLTTLHADHDSFHLASSVRHTQPHPLHLLPLTSSTKVRSSSLHDYCLALSEYYTTLSNTHLPCGTPNDIPIFGIGRLLKPTSRWIPYFNLRQWLVH